MKKNIFDMVSENIEMLEKLKAILRDNRDKTNSTEFTSDMLMYSPDEWNVIALIFVHYNEAGKELRTMKDKEKEAWIIENKYFVGLVYDLLLCLTDRLKKEVAKA